MVAEVLTPDKLMARAQVGHLSPATCNLRPVTCQLPPFTCHPSPVTRHLSPVQELGEEWVSQGRPRTLRGGSSLQVHPSLIKPNPKSRNNPFPTQELKAANARESMDLGRAFVSSQFLEIQVPGHLATWPPGHLATWPPGHLATWPPDHLATYCLVNCPPGHLVLKLVKTGHLKRRPIPASLPASWRA